MVGPERPDRTEALDGSYPLPRDGWAKCDQPMTIPATLLGPHAGRLSPDANARLDTALRFVLGL